MYHILYGYLIISGIAFVIILLINLGFFVRYLPKHVDDSENEFGSKDSLEVCVYVVLHSLATFLTYLVHCALRALQWPYLLGKTAYIAGKKDTSEPQE